jgi:hypothetical protein
MIQTWQSNGFELYLNVVTYGGIVKFCMWYILRYWQYIHCSVKTIEWLINWKGFGSKRPWPNRDTIPACSWRLRKTTKISVRIADVLVEIRSHELLNTQVKSLSLIKDHAMKISGVGSGKLVPALASPVTLGSGSRDIFLSHDDGSRAATTYWGVKVTSIYS